MNINSLLRHLDPKTIAGIMEGHVYLIEPIMSGSGGCMGEDLLAQGPFKDLIKLDISDLWPAWCTDTVYLASRKNVNAAILSYEFDDGLWDTCDGDKQALKDLKKLKARPFWDEPGLLEAAEKDA